MAYFIDRERCVACGYCAFLCAFGAVVEKREDGRDYFEINDGCTGCGQCAAACLVSCIRAAKGHRAITKIAVNAEKCIGCSICKKNCPANAIDGIVKQPFAIDAEACIKCGVCAAKCPKKAIDVEYEPIP